MVEEEANIHRRCTLCKRTGLDISFSLSHVNLHNKPLILVSLSSLYNEETEVWPGGEIYLKSPKY